jgi:hypothetical protein
VFALLPFLFGLNKFAYTQQIVFTLYTLSLDGKIFTPGEIKKLTIIIPGIAITGDPIYLQG